MIEKPRHFTPPPVSKYYIYDWQFAVDIFNATVLQFISLVVLLLPMAIDSQQRNFISIPKSLVIASLLFISAMLIYYIFCPRFIREYRDYGQYQARNNSHRWIVWEFYNNLKSLAGWKTIVRETVSKGVSVELSKLKNVEIKTELEKSFREGESDDLITIYKPININRDIYLPILLEDKKIILFLEEDDKKLSVKEKELYWILYSQAVKEKVVARVIFWILIYTSIIFSLWTGVYVIMRIATK